MTYLGPHVCCKVEKVPSTRQIQSCSNDSCELAKRETYGVKKFCDNCGSPIAQRDLSTIVDSVDAHHVRMDLLSETLYDVPGDSFWQWMQDNNTHIWMANRHIPDARKFYFDTREDIQYIPFALGAMQMEIIQFCDFYEKELVILRQEYGEENVEVRWGLIHYFN